MNVVEMITDDYHTDFPILLAELSDIPKTLLTILDKIENKSREDISDIKEEFLNIKNEISHLIVTSEKIRNLFE